MCCQLEKGLIKSTSSDTSRFGEISRLALQTELVLKRGIQSVGVDHFRAVANGLLLQHAFKVVGMPSVTICREAYHWCYGGVNSHEILDISNHFLVYPIKHLGYFRPTLWHRPKSINAHKRCTGTTRYPLLIVR